MRQALPLLLWTGIWITGMATGAVLTHWWVRAHQDWELILRRDLRKWMRRLPDPQRIPPTHNLQTWANPGGGTPAENMPTGPIEGLPRTWAPPPAGPPTPGSNGRHRPRRVAV